MFRDIKGYELYLEMSLVFGQSNLKDGSGVVNTLINKLPFELHYPGYQFLGPGSNLKKRLARGDRGVNELDRLALQHDLKYAENQDDLSARHQADYELENGAWKRVTAPDAKVGERVAAYITTNLMKIKRKLGMGLKRKKKQRARKKKQLRVLPTPEQIGGVLPLVPILGALGSIGAAAHGANSVVNLARSLLGSKKGNGMRLAPYRTGGKGMRLAPYHKGSGLVAQQQPAMKKKKKNSRRRTRKKNS